MCCMCLDECAATERNTDMATQVNFVKNTYNRILDLVLTNMPTNVIVNEDPYHPVLFLNLESTNIKFMKSKKTIKQNFFEANMIR